MAKTIDFDNMIDTESEAERSPVAQRGAGQGAPKPVFHPPKKLSLQLDGETYQALRTMAFETQQTHQQIMLEAVSAHLRKYAGAQARKKG